jgi:competence protein ComGF
MTVFLNKPRKETRIVQPSVRLLWTNLSVTDRNSDTTEKNCPFSVKVAVELKTIKTANNNNKQQNTIKVNTSKAISKYYNGVLILSTFSFAHS